MGMLRRLGGMLPQSVKTRMIESLGGNLPSLGSEDPDLEGFRRITDRHNTRDFDIYDHRLMVKLAHKLYDSNPLAGWLVDQRVEIVVGTDVTYSIEFDEEIEQELGPDWVQRTTSDIRRFLDRFWEHPSHNIREKAEEYITTFAVSGNLCLPIADHNRTTGVPSLDVVDAELLAGVKMIPRSCLVVDKIGVLDPKDTKPEWLTVARIHPGSEIYSEAEAFFFRNSRLLNARLGRSELMRTADFIDALDQYLFACVDAARLSNMLVWDHTLENADETKCRARLVEVQKHPWEPGSHYFHNEKETVESKIVNVGGADRREMARMILTYILGSKGIPESWFGSGSETNRATAAEQNDVIFKALEYMQKQVRTILGTLLTYTYDVASLRQNILPDRTRYGLRLLPVLPKISERDVSRVAASLSQIANAMGLAVDDELVSKQTARRTFRRGVEQLGVEVDANEEDEAIEREAKERQAEKDRNRDLFASRLAGGGQMEPGGSDGDESQGQEEEGAG